MRLNEYLTESKSISIEDSLEIMKKDCSEYIRELKAGKNFFIRMSSKYNTTLPDSTLVIPAREGREPKDINKELHAEMDDMLKSKFGWKPRSEALFVWLTRKGKSVWNWKIMWRRVRIIFPSNGYKYVYSPNIIDIFNSYEEKMIHYERNNDNDYNDNIRPDRESYKQHQTAANTLFLDWFWEKALDTYTDKNALKSEVSKKSGNVECMLRANKIYAISPVHIPKLNELWDVNIAPLEKL